MYYEQFIEGDNWKVLSLVNNIKNAILILAVLNYILFSSFSSILLIILYLIVCILTLNVYVEYEYEITDNELDIFKISNKKRRKLVKCIEINKAEILIDSKDFNVNKYKGIKVLKLYTKKYDTCDKQIIIFKEPNVTNIYELTLNEELLKYTSRIKRA